MLYIISSPIGNLEDITFRAIRILSLVDYILSEDTRKTSILLKKYNIKKPLFSFHKFNERFKEDKIIKDLENKQEIALISDAGTPLISDPGFSLVKKCIEKKIEITSIPGPCSIITALTLSGLNPISFQFLGFFPKKPKDRDIQKILTFKGISIFFESNKRILKTLKILQKHEKNLYIVLARELTKKFEECIRGHLDEILNIISKKNIKGEIVLLIDSSHID